ncbi:MAG: histidine phosphatase family protein [Candidatus Polarisedimenticolaceae bacterium]|nr:histidine phosphatase family protein [Candidatus Polarisedimenticolaceae bacterium]
MSKTITLIRHATASWDQTNQSDYDRPLTCQGEQDATMMGQRLASDCYQPDLLIASPAQRAKETALLIAKEINYPAQQIDWQEKIYEASLNGLVDLVTTQDDDLQSITLVGHNPGLTSLCHHLLSNDAMINHLPTCGMLQLSFEVKSWRQISAGSGQLIRYEQP